VQQLYDFFAPSDAVYNFATFSVTMLLTKLNFIYHFTGKCNRHPLYIHLKAQKYPCIDFQSITYGCGNIQ